MILSCRKIKKSYGVDDILKDVSFHMEEKEKVAIVGVNGAGKTTLFKILTNNESYDDGEIYIKKDATMSYMAQNQQIESDKTIYDELLSVFQPIMDIEKKLRTMEEAMGEMGNNDKETEEFMNEYSLLQHEFEEKDGYSYNSRIKGVFKGLGFNDSDMDKPLNLLSGGQKTRVCLGKLLLTKPNILLLDEPTNHLDIDAIEWLEDFLKNYDGAVLIISHDRYFLNKVVTKIVEIEHKRANIFNGNYSFYTVQKEFRMEIEQKAYDNQQKELKHQEDVIKTLKSFNREKSVKRAESREKALNKIEVLEKPEALPSHMKLTLTPQIVSGNDVLYVEDVAKSFENRVIFEDISFFIQRGEKVAIIGANGVGKSTLFKILLNLIKKDKGLIRLGTNVNIGYYDQEQAYLDESKTIFDEIAYHYPTLTSGQIRNMLASFVFTGDDVFKPISALSGGEKGRVSLAKIMLSKANCLMLDEPTNHLDMYSKEILENAVSCYEGTVIYISHDRYFINKTAEKVIELTPKGVNVYNGNYDYYISKRKGKVEDISKSTSSKGALDKALGIGNGSNVNNSGIDSVGDSVTNSKGDWLKHKEEEAVRRKLANQVTKIEKEIEEIEEKIVLADEKMVELSSDYTKAQEIFLEKEALQVRLDELYIKWEELN